MSGLASALVGIATGAASAYANKQNEEYKDAKLKAIMSGGAMPEKPKSLGSQLVDKVKENLPTFGYDGSKSIPAKTADASNNSAGTAELPKSSDAEFSDAFHDESVVSSDPVAYQSVYGRGLV